MTEETATIEAPPVEAPAVTTEEMLNFRAGTAPAEEEAVPVIPEEKKEEPAPDAASLQKQLADTQRWGNESSQKLAEATKSLAELRDGKAEEERSKVNEERKVKALAHLKDDAYFEDPQAAVAAAIEELIKIIPGESPVMDLDDIVSRKVAEAQFTQAEQTFMVDTPDYLEKVNDNFVEFLQADSSWYKAWRDRGGNPPALYDLAKRWEGVQAMLTNPDGYVGDAVNEGDERFDTGSQPSQPPPPGSEAEPSAGSGMNAFMFNELGRAKK